MDLPFTVKLPSDFGIGSVLDIQAKPTEKDAWFSLSFMEGNQILADKYEDPQYLCIFQLQLRFDEGIAVLNSVGPGADSHEQREDLPIPKGEKVKMEIRVTKNKFKIFMNDNLFARFPHRHPVDQIKYVNIYGCFNTKSFSHKLKPSARGDDD